METNTQLEQTKSRHWIVSFFLLLSACGIIYLTTFLLPYYSKLFNYTNWDYGPEFYGKEPPEIYGVLNTRIFLLLFVTFGSCILLMIFLFKLHNWKRSGFWGFAITISLTSFFSIFQLSKIKEGLTQMNVDYTFKPLIILACSVLFIILLYGILHIKKSRVSCWSQLE